jgi:hypothetical protein
VPHSASGQSTRQERGVPLLYVLRSKLLQLHVAKVRHDLPFGKFPVSLERLGRQAHRIVEVSPNIVANGHP